MQTKLNTPHEMPKSTILEQRPDFIKSRFEYSNGLILIMEEYADETTVHSNYNWIKNSDESLTPDYSSPDLHFIDER